MIDRLAAVEDEYALLETSLGDPDVLGDPAQLRSVSKRYKDLTPLVEARNVHLPDPMGPAFLDGGGASTVAWVTDLTEEAREFPNAAHDDTVDSMSQAVHRLLLVPLMSGDVLDEHDKQHAPHREED